MALVTTLFTQFVWAPPLIRKMHQDWFFRGHGTHWSLQQALDYLDRFIVHDPEETCLVIKFTSSAYCEDETCHVELFRCRPNSTHRYATWSLALTEDTGRALLARLRALGPYLEALVEKRQCLKDLLQRQCLRVWFLPHVVAQFFSGMRPVDILTAWLDLPAVPMEIQKCIVMEAHARRHAWHLSDADVLTLYAGVADPAFTESFTGAWCARRNELFMQLYQAHAALPSLGRSLSL